MNRILFSLLIVTVVLTGCGPGIGSPAYKGLNETLIHPQKESTVNDTIVYHQVHVDETGKILSWYSPNPGRSYDYVLSRVWNFWKNIEIDSNGQPYYMNHQVWRKKHDRRGLGGDQVMMALSSWDLYYNYTGDTSLIGNMKYMADYYLAHSLSPANSKWPNLPYPYNTNVESGIYDGDMILGRDYLQPDKAGSLGFELVKLYKKTSEEKYLNAAIEIANTLAAKAQPGDSTNSPWPFKVNAINGEPGVIVLDQVTWYEGMDKDLGSKHKRTMHSTYTSFWTGTLELFMQLIALKKGNTTQYKKAFEMALDWMKNYPAKTNKWGPFFEDVPRWSDTQINAITYAQFLMEHPELDPEWRTAVKNIIQWVHKELGNNQFEKYGVITTDEQTAYRVPGNSHSSRQGAAELMYWEKTGDTSYVQNAVRQLNWATYMVDSDGKNFYPTNDIWMTDGYGDYVRHYLRAMAAAPQLAPEDAHHLLRTSSVIQTISYTPQRISYTSFDTGSTEIFRLTAKPKKINTGGESIKEVSSLNTDGWTWQELDKGGILIIRRSKAGQVEILL